MLIRNCDLFKPNDINVRTSIFSRNPKHYLKDAYMTAWIEFIKDCLGGGIIHSDTPLSFTVQKAGLKSSIIFNGTGQEFIKKLRAGCQKPVSVRIDILGKSTRSWIILVADFC